ncbi:MAG: hypothetical protein NT069_16330 [Planctomycetota bacterium]|nr:hypothetical protein [Planctomycetota bacterium]
MNAIAPPRHILIAVTRAMANSEFEFRGDAAFLRCQDDVVAIIDYQKYSWGDHFTLNFGFHSRSVAILSGCSAEPCIGVCNSAGFGFRPRELEIAEPPQGFSIHGDPDFPTFSDWLAREVSTKLTPVLGQLGSLQGWETYCRHRLADPNVGRAFYHVRLGYLLLAQSHVAHSEVEKAITAHAGDPHQIPYRIDHQRKLLARRWADPTAFFQELASPMTGG